MLRNGILQDIFGMLRFLSFVGLRIDGRILKNRSSENYTPYKTYLMYLL